MAGPVMVPPGRAGALIQAPSKEMQRIRDKCEEIWKIIQDIKQHSLKTEHQAALDFFGRLRALSGIVGLLEEQPGYRPTDPERQVERDRMRPLKQKMDEIIQHLDTKVDMMDPLPYTAPKRVAWLEFRAEDLWKILIDKKNIEDLEAVGADKTLSYETKVVFFDWVGYHLNDAMLEVLKTKKHEEKILETVTKALDSHEKNTMAGACLWLGQTAASAGGNLPGPNSLYVGMIRIRAIGGLKELAARAPSAVLGDILPHWFKALNLSSDEQKKFTDALEDFNKHHKTAASGATELAIRDARATAQDVYENRLKPLLKDKGSPQSGVLLSGGVSLLNLVCLYFVWASTPDMWAPGTWNFKNWADVSSATAMAGSGICATLTRTKFHLGWMKTVMEHPHVGIGLGYFTAAVSIIDGAVVIADEMSKTKTDWWMVTSGGLQIGSGLAIVLGVTFSSPGGQLVGVLLGFAAGAIAVVNDLTKDNMVEFIKELLEKIKTAQSAFDQSLIMNNVGLGPLLSQFEGLVASCQVTTLAHNHNWTARGGMLIGKGILHDRLNALGISDGLQRAKLIRAVWV